MGFQWMARVFNIRNVFPHDGSYFDPATDRTFFSFVNYIKTSTIKNFFRKITSFDILCTCKKCEDVYPQQQLIFKDLRIKLLKFFNEINQHLLVTGCIYATAQSQSHLDSQTCYFI